MGVLDKYARKHKATDPRTETVTTKLSKDEYERYLKYVEERGLSISEATRYLILEEINQGNEEETGKGILEYTTVDTQLLISSTRDMAKPLRDIERPRPKPKRIQNVGQRFTTKRWQLNGKTACPLCQEWVSTGNFRRHVDSQHKGIPTHEIFTNPENVAIADRMVQEELEKGGET